MKCAKCGKSFEAGTRPDGLPNGVGFELQDGRIIKICADCITALGGMNDAQRKQFFSDIDIGIVQ